MTTHIDKKKHDAPQRRKLRTKKNHNFRSVDSSYSQLTAVIDRDFPFLHNVGVRYSNLLYSYERGSEQRTRLRLSND
jgi:hypothetical protein